MAIDERRLNELNTRVMNAQGVQIDALDDQTMVVNMGPQHPSTHGVLRVVLELDGEVIVRATPHIGYVHTGIEKTIEYKTYMKAVTLTDRMDYVASLLENSAYSLSVEKLLGIEIPPRGQVLRVMLMELERLASHLVWLGTHILDLGAMTDLLLRLSAARKDTGPERDDVRRPHDDQLDRAGRTARRCPGWLAGPRQRLRGRFPPRYGRDRKPAQRQPDFPGAHAGRGNHQRGGLPRARRGRPDPARSGRQLRHPQGRAYSGYENFEFSRPDGRVQRRVRPLSASAWPK